MYLLVQVHMYVRMYVYMYVRTCVSAYKYVYNAVGLDIYVRIKFYKECVPADATLQTCVYLMVL